MKLNYILVCDAATIDASHKVNLVGIFDRVFGPAFPMSIASMSIAFELMDVVDEHMNIKLEIKQKSTGMAIGGMEDSQSLDLTKSNRFRMLAKSDGLVFPEPGEYEIVITANKETFVAPSVITAIKTE